MDRMGAITAEINRLRLEDQNSPRPDEVKWVDSGIKIRDYWGGLTVPERRDWLKMYGWKVVAKKNPDGEWSFDIDPGTTEELALINQAESLGVVL
jgi:hypothetical protein